MADAIIFCGYQRLVSTKPAGAYVIANTLRSCGLSVMVINFTLLLHRENKLRDLIDKFVSQETKFICMSNTIMTNPNTPEKQNEFLEEVKQILGYCKSRSPNSVVIMGGSDTAVNNVYGSLPINYAIEGQGEAAILAVIDHEINGKPLSIRKTVNGVKYISDKTYGYNTFNSDDYYKFNQDDCVEWGETLPIEIGRGCVFRCSYCNFPLNGKNFEDFNKSTDITYDTLMHNYEKFGVTRYVFIDDTINDSIQKARELERVVSKLPFKFQFAGFMRLELFQKHPEMMEIYKNCGLLAGNFGIETFNREAGLTVGKGFGEKAKDVLMQLKENWKDDVAVVGSFIVGLPYDSPEQQHKQFQWIEDNNALHYYKVAALQIREGDYLLEDPRLKDYYKTIQLKNSYVYDWTSPLMTRMEAIRLATHFNNQCEKNRAHSMYRYLDSFRIPVALQYFTKQQLSGMPANKLDVFGAHTVKIQINKYLSLMDQVQLRPSDPSTWKFPEIQANTHAFEEKIKKITFYK